VTLEKGDDDGVRRRRPPESSPSRARLTEAAALVGADIEAQGVEESEELDDANVIRVELRRELRQRGPRVGVTAAGKRLWCTAFD
jgi:hypothetical protein